jgi:hypothetical protein
MTTQPLGFFLHQQMFQQKVSMERWRPIFARNRDPYFKAKSKNRLKGIKTQEDIQEQIEMLQAKQLHLDPPTIL